MPDFVAALLRSNSHSSNRPSPLATLPHLPALPPSLSASGSAPSPTATAVPQSSSTRSPSPPATRRRRPSTHYRRSFSGSATPRTSADSGALSDGSATRPCLENPGKDHERPHHRLSFNLHLGRSHQATLPPPPATLEWEIETPPVMLHGRPNDSTGALISGQVKLEIQVAMLEVSSCDASLSVRVVQKRPYQAHCKACETQVTQLKSWRFLPAALAMRYGIHSFPFSALVEGHLPATMESSVGSISYEFAVTATTKTGQAIHMRKVVPVRRSIPETGQDHHSVRVFPPTNIAANVYYPSVIHPGQENILRLHMTGLSRVISDNVKHPQVEYWKLRKLSWRLDETVRMVAPACDRHLPRTAGSPPAASPRKGIQRLETRSVGLAELTDGWKAVYSPHDSEMEIEMKYAAQMPRRMPRPICDLRASDGTEVTHSLVLELVVVQEVAPLSQASQSQPTGTARILRMHFSTVVTEESAEGDVSWDCEAPPTYEDVPPSPPAYPVNDAAPAYDAGGGGRISYPAAFSTAGDVEDSLVTVTDGSEDSTPRILEARGSSDSRVPSA